MTNERLTGLALMHTMHRHIALDIDAIIDNFARADTRNEECIFLILFPLTIDIVNILKDINIFLI